DLQFRASPKFIVGSGGHSFSSVGAIPSAVATTTSGTKSDPTTTMRNALNTTNLTNNPRGSNISLDNDKTLVSNKEDVRRNSSACTEEFVAFTINETSKEEEENNNRQQTSSNK
uniref:Uncharacterized protein n=1 Tax=Meloidogyne javanica TaxID=6303 RepID=A0A915LET0_MELJA